MNFKVWLKIFKNQLRRRGFLSVGISRNIIDDLNQRFEDIELIWTGKEYPKSPPPKFGKMGDIDNIFTTIALEWCANAIHRHDGPILVFCRVEDELCWSIGLGGQIKAIGDRQLQIGSKLDLNYQMADLRTLPFESESFNVVAIPQYLYYAGVSYVPESLYDVWGDLNLLKEINRVLKPGGQCVGSLFVRNGHTIIPVGFQRVLGLESYRDLVQKSGFNIVREKFFDGKTACEISEPKVSDAMPNFSRPSDGLSDRVMFEAIKQKAPKNQL